MLEHEDVDKYHLDTLCIDIPTLQNNHYLDKGKIKNPKDKSEMKGFVKVKYDDNKKQYEFIYTEQCTQKTVTPIIETILSNEEAKVVNDNDGLYETTDSYVYRGSNPNNYISLSGNSTPNGRIVSIDKATKMAKVVMLADNPKQWPEEGLIEYLNAEFESGTTFENFKQFISVNTKWNSGKTEKLDNAEVIKSNEKQGSEYHTIGLLTMGEYIDASLDDECYASNDCNSYLTTNKKYWLLNKVDDNKEWYVDIDNLKNITIPVETSQVDYNLYPVFNLKLNTSVTGTGTYDNPYVVEE